MDQVRVNVTAGDVSHTNNCMHENHRRWMTADCEWSWSMRNPIHSRWALAHSYGCTVHGRTNTSSTHSDVQAHIPLVVGSWSKERMCEICQPIGDWVIEEFDSERNILLPWWWTRRNDSMFSRRKVQQEEKKLIINTYKDRGNNTKRFCTGCVTDRTLHMYSRWQTDAAGSYSQHHCLLNLQTNSIYFLSKTSFAVSFDSVFPSI